MRIAEKIANWLARHGVNQVFTVTGGGSMFLNQAFGTHEKIDSCYMHHEQACAMAAEGYARIAGKPGLVVVTTGPGSINALNGVFGAYTDSIPMIVISGQVKTQTCLSFHDELNLRQLGDQEGPTIDMVSPITKYARLIRTPQDLVVALPEAFRQAVTGRPGPVWLDIPLDIQSSIDEIHIPDVCIASIYNPSCALIESCTTIIKKLLEAKRPIILGGTGVRIANATEKLLHLVESAGIPLATAWTHDLIASDHPLFAGRPGTIGSRAGNFCLQAADLVLVIGSRLNIRQTSYNWNTFAKNAYVVHVDIDPTELKKPTYQADLVVEVDAAIFIETLSKLLSRVSLPSFKPWTDWCQRIAIEYDVRKEHEQNDPLVLNPYVVVDRIFNLMREDDVVVCGNASACIIPFQIGRLKARQRMFSNSGSASMGHDLPAAIGAAYASVKRVICFAGDGSLQMNIQELQTLKTSQKNVVIVVLNNAGYLSIWQTHENFFGLVVGATPASGVGFPDFTAVAKAYGVKSKTIQTVDDLNKLDALIASDGPLLINIIVDSRQEFVPRIKSRIDENGKFVTPELDDMHPFLDVAKLDRIRKSAELIS
jgi:acetolactate synthase-1/2/3 large subunit